MKTSLKFFMLPILLMGSIMLTGAEVPYLTGRVNDYAQILSSETNQLLTEILKAHENRTGRALKNMQSMFLKNGNSARKASIMVF